MNAQQAPGSTPRTRSTAHKVSIGVLAVSIPVLVLGAQASGNIHDASNGLHDRIAAVLDAQDRSSDEVMRLAYLNAALETGIENPLDAAIVAAGRKAALTAEGVRKIDEIPYDFERRRLTIVMERAAEPGRPVVVARACRSGP